MTEKRRAEKNMEQERREMNEDKRMKEEKMRKIMQEKDEKKTKEKKRRKKGENMEKEQPNLHNCFYLIQYFDIPPDQQQLNVSYYQFHAMLKRIKSNKIREPHK